MDEVRLLIQMEANFKGSYRTLGGFPKAFSKCFNLNWSSTMILLFCMSVFFRTQIGRLCKDTIDNIILKEKTRDIIFIMLQHSILSSK